MSRKRLPRFFVAHDAIAGERAVLTGEERHHARVCRLRPGARVELFDDCGREYDALVNTATAELIELTVTERVPAPRESGLALTLAVALLKADKLDLVIEKATELGVAEVVVFRCERTLGGSGSSRRERWQRIALSAAKQCGRSAVPRIYGPESLEALARRPADLRLVCWEQASAAAGFPGGGCPASVLIAVGPEGGFTTDEVTRLQAAGFSSVSLGPRMLRAETAAITAAALAQARWGDLGGRA
ncbi:MAG: 16S rRNA (uracil(1498)-N(3))-methyltransferase [Deltaproteobacteria bacterium]|nr:16S rRNA (uracil(1498)-N(3))-methyltransferase [Deltaproteobacteria bacterium]